MNKYLKLLLVPMLAFYVGCEDDDDNGGSSTPTNPLVGVYDMTSVVASVLIDPSMNFVSTSTFNANGTTNSITLILSESGSYSTTGSLNGEANTFGGTWSSTGNKLTIFETSPSTVTEIYDYTLSGNNLTMTITTPETTTDYETTMTFNYTKQ
jgi:hypothetical protein